MTISVFDGEEDAYWWVLCTEKVFKEQGIPEAAKLPEAVTALRGRANQWWQWRSQHHPRLTWEAFTTVFLWRFKPEYRDVLPIDDEDEEPELESQKATQGGSVDSHSSMVEEGIWASSLSSKVLHPEQNPTYNGSVTMTESSHETNDLAATVAKPMAETVFNHVLVGAQSELSQKGLAIETRAENQLSKPSFPWTRDYGDARTTESSPGHQIPLDSYFLLLPAQGSSVSSRESPSTTWKRHWKTPPWRRKKQRSRSTMASLSHAFGDLKKFWFNAQPTKSLPKRFPVRPLLYEAADQIHHFLLSQRRRPLRVTCVRYPHLRRLPTLLRCLPPPPPPPPPWLPCVPWKMETHYTLRVANGMGEPLKDVHSVGVNTILGLVTVWALLLLKDSGPLLSKRRKKKLFASSFFPFLYFMFEDTILDFAAGLRAMGARPDEKLTLFANNSYHWLVANQGMIQIAKPFYLKASMGFIIPLWGEKACLVSEGTKEVPILYFILRDFNFATTDADIGSYAGYVGALFTIGRALTTVLWALISDYYGRKLVIVITRVVIVVIFNPLFGLSTSFWMTFIIPCLLGSLNGALGQLKAYATDFFIEEHQTLGLSTVSAIWGMGLIIGQALGGSLAQPIETYPHILMAWEQVCCLAWRPIVNALAVIGGMGNYGIEDNVFSSSMKSKSGDGLLYLIWRIRRIV